MWYCFIRAQSTNYSRNTPCCIIQESVWEYVVQNAEALKGAGGRLQWLVLFSFFAAYLRLVDISHLPQIVQTSIRTLPFHAVTDRFEIIGTALLRPIQTFYNRCHPWFLSFSQKCASFFTGTILPTNCPKCPKMLLRCSMMFGSRLSKASVLFTLLSYSD